MTNSTHIFTLALRTPAPPDGFPLTSGTPFSSRLNAIAPTPPDPTTNPPENSQTFPLTTRLITKTVPASQLTTSAFLLVPELQLYLPVGGLKFYWPDKQVAVNFLNLPIPVRFYKMDERLTIQLPYYL